MSKAKNNAQEESVKKEIDARLRAFARHKKELLNMLRDVKRSPKAKAFDDDDAWKHLRFMAYVYLQDEALISQQLARMPTADNVKLLRQLADALGKARRRADMARRTVRGHWFVAWCEAHGNPDFTDPIIDFFDAEFDRVVAGLADLETAAFRATETIRKTRGRTPGTGVMPHDIIIALESMYRDITKAKAGAGPGPFARFVIKFLTALGRECTEQSAIKAIIEAKKREEKHLATSRWGRSFIGP